MKPTLNLFQHLLARGQRYVTVRRRGDALRVLLRLTDFPEVPMGIAEQAHALVGEIFLRGRRYGRAQRHLAQALALAPRNARYRYLMARACSADGRMERAATHYRHSLKIEPNQLACRYEYGLLLVRMGRAVKGLEHLEQAVRGAPEDVKAAARLVRGLRLAGETARAREAARSALFRNPRNLQFLQLWRDVQFREVAGRQRRRRETCAHRRPLPGPALLPFPGPRDTPAWASETLRQDEPASLPAPHGPRSARRHVQ